MNLLWLVVGDFNEILWSDEKKGGHPRRRGLMQAFRTALLDSHLDDLGYSGVKFTLEKVVVGGDFMHEQLDRTLASASWQAVCPNCVGEGVF